MTDAIASLTPATAPVGRPARSDDDSIPLDVAARKLWASEDGPSFDELLDIINPLQHIPIVSSIYRAVTGDQIGLGARLAGGALFGGGPGALIAGLSAIFEEASGGDLGTHVTTLASELFGSGEAPTTLLAQAKAAAATETAAGGALAATAAAPARLQAQAQLNVQAQAVPQPPAQQELTAAAVAGNAAAPVPARALPAAHTEAAPLSLAAKSAATPFPAFPASAMNRIRLNPSAALGVPIHAPTAGSLGGGALPARPHVTSYPAHPHGIPAGQLSAAQPLPAQSRAAEAAAAPQGDAESQRIRAEVHKAQRAQADALLARWAEKQMAAQQRAAATAAQSAGSADAADRTRPAAAAAQPVQNVAPVVPAVAAPAAAAAQAHPMLPPENASAEWYAQAMSSALSRYQAAQNGHPVIPPSGIFIRP